MSKLDNQQFVAGHKLRVVNNRSVNYKHSDKIKIDKLNNQINELSLEEEKGDNDE